MTVYAQRYSPKEYSHRVWKNPNIACWVIGVYGHTDGRTDRPTTRHGNRSRGPNELELDFYFKIMAIGFNSKICKNGIFYQLKQWESKYFNKIRVSENLGSLSVNTAHDRAWWCGLFHSLEDVSMGWQFYLIWSILEASNCGDQVWLISLKCINIVSRSE